MDSTIYIIKLKLKEQYNCHKGKGGRWIEKIKNIIELHEGE